MATKETYNVLNKVRSSFAEPNHRPQALIYWLHKLLTFSATWLTLSHWQQSKDDHYMIKILEITTKKQFIDHPCNVKNRLTEKLLIHLWHAPLTHTADRKLKYQKLISRQLIDSNFLATQETPVLDMWGRSKYWSNLAIWQHFVFYCTWILLHL